MWVKCCGTCITFRNFSSSGSNAFSAAALLSAVRLAFQMFGNGGGTWYGGLPMHSQHESQCQDEHCSQQSRVCETCEQRYPALLQNFEIYSEYNFHFFSFHSFDIFSHFVNYLFTSGIYILNLLNWPNENYSLEKLDKSEIRQTLNLAKNIF